jgi:integral membrane protein
MMNNLRILSILGFFEGISFLVLLGVCMPMKYIFEIPEATSLAGMVHGILFMAYSAWVFIVASELKWSKKEMVLALVASVVPFGTFIADKKIFKPYAGNL